MQKVGENGDEGGKTGRKRQEWCRIQKKVVTLGKECKVRESA